MLNYNIQNYAQARYMEHSDAMGKFQLSIKRLFDIVFSLVGLVVLSPLFLHSASVDPPICLRIITIGCPLLVHRMSTKTMDIRWRCDGDSMDILCSHIEGTQESERTYLGGLSDTKRISDVEYTYHHRMIFLYRHAFFMYCSYSYKVN